MTEEGFELQLRLSDRKITDLSRAGGSSRRSRLLYCGMWL
jgi:hypothetical protein